MQRWIDRDETGEVGRVLDRLVALLVWVIAVVWLAALGSVAVFVLWTL